MHWGLKWLPGQSIKPDRSLALLTGVWTPSFRISRIACSRYCGVSSPGREVAYLFGLRRSFFKVESCPITRTLVAPLQGPPGLLLPI